jgi:hypothetical protein
MQCPRNQLLANIIEIRQLLKEEVMNTYQLVLLTTKITVPNVFVLRTQAMNPNMGHTTVPNNY